MGENQKQKQENSSNRPLIITAALIVILLAAVYLIKPRDNSKLAGAWEDKNDSIIFMTNGNFTSSYYWVGGQYNYSDNTVTLSTGAENSEACDYTVSGDTLTITRNKDNGGEKLVFNKVK